MFHAFRAIFLRKPRKEPCKSFRRRFARSLRFPMPLLVQGLETIDEEFYFVDL